MNYIDKLFNLNNKTAVITGGGGVLAATIGAGLANAGMKVVFLDINEEAAINAANKIVNNGGDAIGLKSDVLSKEALEVTCNLVMKKYKTIDLLLNAAGGNMSGASVADDDTVFNLNIDHFDKVNNLNFKGTVLPSLVFGKVMADRKSGNIINISSMAALQSITRQIGYSAAKAAVSNFTMWMSMELAMKFEGKIRVNAIAPGFFIGNQNRALLINDDGSYTERGQKVINNTPMRRFGEADELIGAILYLASDAATFVTGVVLPVDGGFSTFSGV